MLFGAGATMTDQELAKVEDVAFPAFAAMALANDYFSFDREFAERGATIPGSEEEPLINAVWLCTQWSDVDIEQAKELVRAKTIFYEEEYASRKSAFFRRTRDQRTFGCVSTESHK